MATVTITGENNDKQRTQDWYKDRMGRFSCSNFYRLMTEPRNKVDKKAGNLSDGAITYINECVAERLTGKQAKDDFTSKYTDCGLQYEPIAKAIYMEVFSLNVVDSDYISYDFNSGGSPDGLIGEDGLLEAKCPYTITSHLEHKLYELIDKPEYYWQCIGYLLITGRKWIDFVSYHPDYPGKLQMVCKRLNRDDILTDIKKLELKLERAEKEFNLLVDSLK
jgi:hypothetical protein